MDRARRKASGRRKVAAPANGTDERHAMLCLALIVALGVALIFLFRTGIYQHYDDHLYSSFAQQILSSGTFQLLSSPWGYGWAYPYFALLGVPFTALLYLSLIVLTYILGKRVSDNRIGLLAAFLVTVFPFTFQYSTRLLNDMLLGVMATLAMIFILSERKRDWVLAGLLAGAMISIKLIGIAFILPFVIAALFTGKRWHVLAGMLIMAAIYTIPFIIMTGNPLYPLAPYAAFQNKISPSSLLDNTATMFVMLGITWNTTLAPIAYQTYSLGLVLWLAGIALLMEYKRRDLKMAWMSWIFWGFLLYMLFGSISLTHYVFASVLDRYLIIVAAPLAITLAYLFRVLFDTFAQSNRKAAFLVCAALLVLLILSLYFSYLLVWAYNSMIRATNPNLFPESAIMPK